MSNLSKRTLLVPEDDLAEERKNWLDALTEQNGFWDKVILIDVFTGEEFFSREQFVVRQQAWYDPSFRAHLALATTAGLTVKALPQTDLNEVTLVIKPIEHDTSQSFDEIKKAEEQKRQP